MNRIHFLFLFIFFCKSLFGTVQVIGPFQKTKSIHEGICNAHFGDTLIVEQGLYKEGNIVIDLPLVLIGKGLPVLDGVNKYEVLSIKASNVSVSGFIIQNSGDSTMEDLCGIKVYDSNNVIIIDNQLHNNYFGIYIQYGSNCIIKNNKLISFGIKEHEMGNGIHCWKSDSLQIIANDIIGHRDGIYFEFVTNSIIWRNYSHDNIRYGLHFMFSNNDSYITNRFSHNGSGVAVMFTKKVTMMNNVFEENWGDAAYGIFLKEISDSYIAGNKFIENTSGIHMEGTSRIIIERNVFSKNGWGVKIQASCMENSILKNNFMSNTFDISTNGSLVLNTFDANYWDKYEGYDLNKDQIGDIPFHPLSLFSVIIEHQAGAMLLYRSFIISLLDKSEKMFPSLTPDNFVDNKPSMNEYSYN